jgi:hypothetical protein
VPANAWHGDSAASDKDAVPRPLLQYTFVSDGTSTKGLCISGLRCCCVLLQGMLGKKQLEHLLVRLGLMPEGSTLPQAFPKVSPASSARPGSPVRRSPYCVAGLPRRAERPGTKVGFVVHKQTRAHSASLLACSTFGATVSWVLVRGLSIPPAMHHLHSLGPAGLPLALSCQVDVLFRVMWADHGDEISCQYAGTGAMKSAFTRTGKRDLRGLLDDGSKSLTRCAAQDPGYSWRGVVCGRGG